MSNNKKAEEAVDESLHFEKITWDNFEAIINLHVKKEQQNYVARNKDSLVHACVCMISEGKQVAPLGIYKGKKPVGFIMIGYDVGEDDGTEPSADWFLRNNYCIWRFMIDRRYQGNGYGREAFRLALEYCRTFPMGEAKYCWLSYEPENEVAKKLYLSFGFKELPEHYEEGEEMPAVLEL